jgi:transposase-like protein
MSKAIARDPIYRRRRFQPEIIELCVRWYLTYRLSYRDLVEMMAERGVVISYSTILRLDTTLCPRIREAATSPLFQ